MEVEVTSAVFCNHANEMPAVCPCQPDCYCKFHACRSPARAADHPTAASAEGRMSNVDTGGRMRFYVAGPFSAETRAQEWVNVMRANAIGSAIARKGHLAHVPHAATAFMHLERGIDYEWYMTLDLSIIRAWATDLFFIASSPGANRELALANELGLRVWHDIDSVPTFGDRVRVIDRDSRPIGQ